MEKRLIRPKPITDTLALLVIFYPIVRWIVSDVSSGLSRTLQFLLMIPILAISYKIVTQPQLSSTDTKANKRNSRHRAPPLWAWLVRCYLYLSGYSAVSTSSSSPSLSSKSTSCSSQLVPQIRYVGSTYAGVLLPGPEIQKYFVNSMPWTQIYVDAESKVVLFYGLRPNTVYEVRAVLSEDDEDEQASAGVSTEQVEFLLCTAPQGTDDETRPRRQFEIHTEAFKSISEVLSEEKARLRKSKKDSLKKLSSVRHEIDSMNTKLQTKRKADERARKRIQALRDRVSQQKQELADLESSVDAAKDVTKLASEVEKLQRELQSRRQGLDVSVRVWEELQRTKQNEVNKLEGRCTKLSERLKKARNDIELNNAAKDRAVADYLKQLRDERNIRKQRRVRLEADFRAAIAKLITT